MSISIICSRCNTPYTLPASQAGKTVVCKKCNALLDIPGPSGAPGAPAAAPRAVLPSMAASGSARYDRIVGKPAPIFFDIIGLHTQWAPDFTWRDIVRLIWSFYHLVLFIVLLIFWTHYAQTPQSAAGAAPIFLIVAILLFLLGWLHISSIARSMAQDIGAGSHKGPSLLRYLLSSSVLVATEPRAALPALRTGFLAIMTMLAAFSLASEAGSWTYVLPVTSLPSFNTAPPTEIVTPPAPAPRPAATEPAPATAPAPPPPTPEEKPLPPPEDTTPIPPP